MTPKKKNIRAAIVGFGRIGRSIFRINEQRKMLDIVAINDINPDPKNLAYLLQYDSEYGRFSKTVSVEDSQFIIDGRSIAIFHKTEIEKIPWRSLNVDVVIDASGVHRNVLAAPKLLKQGVRKVVITHSPNEVDHTIILGVNELSYKPKKHNIISSSICDAVAIAPVLKIVDKKFGIESGFLTTLHPWLSYQNLLDGPSVSWALPGEVYYHFAVGRSSTKSLIPKPTSAVDATLKVLPHMKDSLRCMSFRVPTPVVGTANLCLRLKRDATLNKIHKSFESFANKQKWPVIYCTNEPLVSVDFLGAEYSSIVDQRWIDLAGKRHLYIVLWYDNEWGYSSHALHLIDYIMNKKKR